MQRKLWKVILKYCCETYPNHVLADCKWENLVKDLPQLDTAEELTRMEQSLSSSYTSHLIMNSKSASAPPLTLTSRIDKLVSQAYGLKQRTRVEPFQVILTQDLEESFEPSINNEQVFSCLAIVKFSRRKPASAFKGSISEIFHLDK